MYTEPKPVICFILTISDAHTKEDDAVGNGLLNALQKAGHTVSGYEVISADPVVVSSALEGILERGDIQAVFTLGGTGFGERDQTVDAVELLFDRKIPGFGELFRMVNFEHAGAGVMRTRATAGICSKTAVFCLPHSNPAVEQATEKIIVPGIQGLIDEIHAP